MERFFLGLPLVKTRKEEDVVTLFVEWYLGD